MQAQICQERTERQMKRIRKDQETQAQREHRAQRGIVLRGESNLEQVPPPPLLPGHNEHPR
jgi:hypothetical protein